MPFCINCGMKLPENSRFCSSCGTPVNQPEAKPAVCGVQRHDDFSSAPKNTTTVQIEMCGLNRVLFKGSQRATINYNGQIVWDGYVGNTASLDVAGRCDVSIHYHMHANFYPGEVNGTVDPAVSTYYQVIPRQSAFHQKLTLQPVYK